MNLIAITVVWLRNISRSRESRQCAEKAGKSNRLRTRANFKQISNNYHGVQGFALLAHS